MIEAYLLHGSGFKVEAVVANMAVKPLPSYMLKQGNVQTAAVGEVKRY